MLGLTGDRFVPCQPVWFGLEIGLDSETELIDEYLLEGIKVVLLIEDKHRLLIVDRINRAETQRAVSIGYQNGIAGDTGCALVAIGECLNIRQEHKCEQSLFKDVLLTVYQVASILQSLSDLEFIIQRMIVGTRNTHTTVTDPSVN